MIRGRSVRLRATTSGTLFLRLMQSARLIFSSVLLFSQWKYTRLLREARDAQAFTKIDSSAVHRLLTRTISFYRLIYEQIRFYLGQNALDDESDPPEEFDCNNIIQSLEIVESVVNPTSLELYVASKPRL